MLNSYTNSLGNVEKGNVFLYKRNKKPSSVEIELENLEPIPDYISPEKQKLINLNIENWFKNFDHTKAIKPLPELDLKMKLE